MLSRNLNRTIYLSVFIVLWTLAAGQAQAGHTIGGRDCWHGAPVLCRNTWLEGSLLNVRLIDQFSIPRPTWMAALMRLAPTGTTPPAPSFFAGRQFPTTRSTT